MSCHSTHPGWHRARQRLTRLLKRGMEVEFHSTRHLDGSRFRFEQKDEVLLLPLWCERELVEGNFVHFVGVKRTNGSSGAVRCNISIVTSNDVHDAEEGKDYRLLSSFVAFGDGDADPKA
eukprot:s242_g12.t1